MTTHLPFFADSSLTTTTILCVIFFQDDNDDDAMFFLWIHPLPQSKKSQISFQLTQGGGNDNNDDNADNDDDDADDDSTILCFWNAAVMPLGFDMRRRR